MDVVGGVGWDWLKGVRGRFVVPGRDRRHAVGVGARTGLGVSGWAAA